MSNPTSPSPASLFALPLELRYAIYSHLCGTEPTSYPWCFSPISSINISPPPLSLRLSCRSIYSEIQAYFYGVATLRFFSSNQQRGISGEHYQYAVKAIRLAKKVEIMLMWYVTEAHAKVDMETWPWALHVYLEKTVEMLLEEGESLELLILSIRDTSDKEVDWSVKRKMLEPLTKLAPTVTFVVGEVTAADDEEAMLRQQLMDYVRGVNARKLNGAGAPNED